MNDFKPGDRVTFFDGLHYMEGTVMTVGKLFPSMVEVLLDGTSYPTHFSPSELHLSEASVLDWRSPSTCTCDIVFLMQEGCKCGGS